MRRGNRLPINMAASKNYSWAGRVGFLASGLLVISMFLMGTFKRFDDAIQDQMFSLRQQPVPSNVVIIEIDSHSLGQISNWPWSRSLYAQVLDQLRIADINSVLIDVDFSSPSNSLDDQMLAQAIGELAQTAKVRLPTFVQPESIRSRQLSLRQPLPMLAEHAELVSVNIQPGNDGLVRQLNAGFIANNAFYSSAWNAIAGRPTQASYIDYAISPASFEYLSFADLLAEPLRPGELRGKDVLLGSTAIELGDIVPVPVHKAVPGVVLHALAVETLLRGGLFVLTPAASVLLLLVMLGLASVILTRVNWFAGCLIVATVFVGMVGVNYYTAVNLSLMLPVFSIFAIWLFAYMAGLIGKIDLSSIQNFWLQINLLDREQLLASVFATSNDSIICVDESGFITSANARSKEIFACESEELIGRSLGEIMPVAREGIDNLALEPFETNIIDAEFRKIPIEVCVSPLKIGGKPRYTLAVRNLKERKEKELALNYAITHDKLTGLLNRVRFFELADEAIDRGTVCTLLKLDIDYFNEINEIHGHDFGDKVLKILSGRIIDLIDSRSIIGRIGKDDFAILVRNKSLIEVKLLAEKILSVLNQPFFVDHQVIDIFCHIGISQVSSSRSNVEELIRLSNIGLQTAKMKGLEYDYCEDLEQSVEPQRLHIIGAIRTSLQHDSFELAFQPKILLENSATVGCEVLLRPPINWAQDVPVYKIIEVAETTRLISDITLGVVDKMIAMEMDWRALSLPREISINLSLGLLANDQFIATLIQKLDQSAGYYHFEFEITETSLSNNWQQSIRNIDRLLTRNVTLAIDDFGTGYSSLAYLRDLRAKVLKIDKSFVSNIHLKLENQSIVQSTIKMAHELGMTVVAEGIEQHLEKEYLREIGCDHGQGFLFAKPMYYPQFTAWSTNRSGSNVVMLQRKSDKNNS